MPEVCYLQSATTMRQLTSLYVPAALESRDLLEMFPLTKVRETPMDQRKVQDSSAKVIQVIVVTHLRGLGVPENPARQVTSYWDFDGNLIAEFDPCANKTEVT